MEEEKINWLKQEKLNHKHRPLEKDTLYITIKPTENKFKFPKSVFRKLKENNIILTYFKIGLLPDENKIVFKMQREYEPHYGKRLQSGKDYFKSAGLMQKIYDKFNTKLHTTAYATRYKVEIDIENKLIICDLNKNLSED